MLCAALIIPSPCWRSRVETSQYDIVYRLLLDDDYRKLLTKTGYKNIEILGGYDGEIYNKKSARLIAVAAA